MNCLHISSNLLFKFLSKGTRLSFYAGFVSIFVEAAYVPKDCLVPRFETHLGCVLNLKQR